MQIKLGDLALSLDAPRVMGVLNVTPDSFSDGGRYQNVEKAVARALTMVNEGADIIDVGGESTRPGAAAISVKEELERVVDVVAAISAATATPVSVDTSKPEVMRAAVAAGATLINDVRALQMPGALEAAADLGVTVCLMHMQGEPQTMQSAPAYTDVVREVRSFLRQRAAACVDAGIHAEQIVLDPGFGFGKTLEHNLELLRNLDSIAAEGFAVLAGLSRKSMIPAIMQKAGFTAAAEVADQRVTGSVLLAVHAVQQGAHIVRVHDVRETVEGLTIDQAMRASSMSGPHTSNS